MKTQRPTRLSTFFPCALVVAGLTSLVSAAQAQTSGTLIPTTEFYNYSTAPWVITGGTGTYPTGGGTATFGPFTMTGFANTNPNQLITLDVSPTLSQIVVNSPYSIAIYPQSNNSSNAIIAANTGLTINTTTARDISSASQVFSLHGGFSIQTPISGGGTAGLTKTGSGNLGLSGVNTYTGGTHVNGGLVLIGGTGYGDVALGATGAGNGLFFNGGGSLTDIASTYAVFNGNNTYSGGTVIRGDIFYAGTNTAFGTGTISFVGGGAPSSATPYGGIAGVGATPRTIANPLLIDNTTASFAGAAPLTLTGPVSLNGASTINVTNTALTTFTGVLSDGGVSKTGTGAVVFNSPTGNTFTGGFVNGAPVPSNPGGNSSAIYANNASGSAFGAGIVSIGAESATVYSTLAGNFSTSGATSIAGRLSPGNGTGLTPATAGIGSLGRETFNTTLTLSSGTTSSLYMEVGAGNASDQIVVGGTFTLASTVYIASLNGYTIQNGDTFTLITAGTLTPGTITFNTSNANLAAGVSLLETFTGTQFIVSAVPEPGTYTLFAVGNALAAASFARRRCMRG